MSRDNTDRGTQIRLSGVTKHYPKSVAVDNVSLTVEPGEFMTFLGPSGSGKTTTLNLIAGFTDLTSGSVELDGRRIDDVPAHKRGLGVVFQHYALFPHMTVADNVAYPLRRRKVGKAEERRLVAASLETAGLSRFADRYPAQLSGGQQQRVALARALVFDPQALLLDEPLGALDKQLRERLQLELRRIHREVGRTFVFVTHDQEEALTLSDRIAIFNEGRIEQVGTAAELYERPQSLFVASFIGESTILRGVEGEHTATVVRPEKLELHASVDNVPDAHARVQVRLLQSVYLGSGWKHEIGLPDGSTGVVRDAGERSTSSRPGESALLSWHPEHAVILDDSNAA
ncbi:ABC transporter ATP-binding protein [Glaciibacter psychrotolerans]|uniref:ABC-type quaternary amine transporter n=1 Tax=Glaciibacter psychrotolerans TaxID=670054 RepID=A0A7Z0J6S6_9MICO|nr:ABC transporter ATP-binding protein [Leifsonia psychrotolerans]NYJ20511.1 putative spermidine/putrescine transport system ATP-binding protein [Leifsonia psychrotolerans]